MRRIGSTTERRALWDVCCSGRVVELDLREGHAYYRTDDPRVHWHPEYEVHEGDSAAMAVKRLNRAALGATGSTPSTTGEPSDGVAAFGGGGR